MDANQNDILDLNGMINEIMSEYVQAEEEVHLEPQPEKRTNVEPEMEVIPKDIPPAVAEEIPSRMIPLSHSYPEQAESLKRNEVSV